MEEIFYYSLFVFHSILQSQTNLNGICVCVSKSVLTYCFPPWLPPSLSLGASLVSGKLWRPEKNMYDRAQQKHPLQYSILVTSFISNEA